MAPSLSLLTRESVARRRGVAPNARHERLADIQCAQSQARASIWRSAIETLDDALPPAAGNGVLAVATVGELGDHTPPKGLRRKVAGHLPDLPLARKRSKDRHRSGLADAGAAVLLEDEELVHPAAGAADLYSTINQRKPGVVTVNDNNEGVAVGSVPVPVKVVAVLAASVELLVPDVRKIVLIELEHSAHRQPIIGAGAADFKLAHGQPE